MDEFLSAEAGVDGHHEQQVNFVEDMVRLQEMAVGRIDGETGFFAERFLIFQMSGSGT